MTSEHLKFIKHSGTVVPFDRANVDTDQIIPKQFLKSIKRTGFGENLFDAWRFLDEGYIGKTDRQKNPEFVLNYPQYRDASILLARRNFGCGSSREHAVWALLQYGFRCVIAPSFADIFYNNSLNNGLLPVTLSETQVDTLFRLTDENKTLTIEVDLETQQITGQKFDTISFTIDPNRRLRLLEGLDEIALTLKHASEIQEFEEQHRQRMPWLFSPR